MTAAPLSAVLIARNAAAVLDACLESLAFADEIVLVDSASSDGTVEIASKRGARVVQKEWLGFGRQKQFAVEQAKKIADWASRRSEIVMVDITPDEFTAHCEQTGDRPDISTFTAIVVTKGGR